MLEIRITATIQNWEIKHRFLTVVLLKSYAWYLHRVVYGVWSDSSQKPKRQWPMAFIQILNQWVYSSGKIYHTAH
jgi:hypothetical protein